MFVVPFSLTLFALQQEDNNKILGLNYLGISVVFQKKIFGLQLCFLAPNALIWIYGSLQSDSDRALCWPDTDMVQDRNYHSLSSLCQAYRTISDWYQFYHLVCLLPVTGIVSFSIFKFYFKLTVVSSCFFLYFFLFLLHCLRFLHLIFSSSYFASCSPPPHPHCHHCLFSISPLLPSHTGMCRLLFSSLCLIWLYANLC